VSAAVALIPAPVPATPTPVVVLRAGDLSAALAPHKAIVANPTLPHHALAHLVAVDTATVTLRTCDGRHDLTSTLAAEASGRVDVLCDAAELAEVVARMDAAKPLRVEVSLAQGAPPCLVVVSEARRGSATEDRVEAVSLEGAKGAKGAPAAINPRRLLEAIETARVLGDDTDVRVAWEYSGSGTMWATGPAGYRSVDAPWWVTTVGLAR
jgi:2-C-methyl-D-erythritol 4-phosphate cytidylyltransferase